MVVIKTGGAGSSAIKGKSYQPDGLIAGTTTQEGHREFPEIVEEDLAPQIKGVTY